MNERTLKRVKENPHYKMSKKQLEEEQEEKRKEMIEFGTPNIHNNHFPLHNVGLEKKSR